VASKNIREQKKARLEGTLWPGKVRIARGGKFPFKDECTDANGGDCGVFLR